MTRKIDVDPIAETLELMPYGLYIVGSRGSDNINGMMADWVMQVSFSPRLVVCSLEKNSTTLRNLRETGVFSVNLLGMDGRELAIKFCQPREAAKVQGRSDSASAVIYDKLADVPHQPGEVTECPILTGGLAYLECEVQQIIEVGDHAVAVGLVLNGGVLKEGDVLTSNQLGWSYAG